MNLWRIQLKTGHNPSDGRAVALCLAHNVIGTGWGVEPAPSSVQDFFNRAATTYGPSGAWRRAITGLIVRMHEGDLVWLRDRTGCYYLARVTGAWRYRNEEEFRRVDIVHTRPVQIVKVGRVVAGKIAACFRPTATLQCISGDTALRWSQSLFNQLSGVRHYAVTGTGLDVLSLLDARDVEDVVAIYLQAERDWMLIPQTRRCDTAYFEYALRHRLNGGTALVQVKSGHEVLNVADYANVQDRVFLFDCASREDAAAGNVEKIGTLRLLEFMQRRRDLLPPHILSWLAQAEDAGQMQFTKPLLS